MGGILCLEKAKVFEHNAILIWQHLRIWCMIFIQNSICYFCIWQPNPELSSDIRLYITLMKKLDKLPLSSVGSKMYGLEVFSPFVTLDK